MTFQIFVCYNDKRNVGEWVESVDDSAGPKIVQKYLEFVENQFHFVQNFPQLARDYLNKQICHFKTLNVDVCNSRLQQFVIIFMLFLVNSKTPIQVCDIDGLYKVVQFETVSFTNSDLEVNLFTI